MQGYLGHEADQWEWEYESLGVECVFCVVIWERSKECRGVGVGPVPGILVCKNGIVWVFVGVFIQYLYLGIGL